MAGSLLMSVSQDERERAIFLSRQKFQTDLASNLATAEDRGRREGKAEGRVKVAQNLLKMKVSLEQIVTATGLSREEVESLYTTVR